MNTIQLVCHSPQIHTRGNFYPNSTGDFFPLCEGLRATSELSVRAIRGETLPSKWREIAQSWDYSYAESLRMWSAEPLRATATVFVTSDYACAQVPLHESILSGEICAENPEFGGMARDWVSIHRNTIERKITFNSKLLNAPWRLLACGEWTPVADANVGSGEDDCGNEFTAKAIIALSPL